MNKTFNGSLFCASSLLLVLANRLEAQMPKPEISASVGAMQFDASGTGTAPVIALLDGDLQNDPKDIPAMLAKLAEGYDLVCGYRAKRKDTAFKRLQSRIANFVRSRFTGDGVRDTGCTLKVLRTPCRDCLILFRGMHRFIPALIKGGGHRLAEMPVNHRPRISGVSKYGFGNRALRATTDMFGVKWLLSRQCRYQVKPPRPVPTETAPPTPPV